MAYMNQSRKRKIQNAVTPILNKYKLKGSLRCDNHGITLTIRKGPIDFIADLITSDPSPPDGPYIISVNQYWIDSHWNGKSREIFNALNTAMKSGDR